MSGNAYIHGLNYDLIKRAVHGDEPALEEILRIYEPFIHKLPVFPTLDVVGVVADLSFVAGLLLFEFR